MLSAQIIVLCKPSSVELFVFKPLCLQCIYNLNISVDLLSWSVWQKVTSICLKNLSQATSQPMRFSTRVSTRFTLNLLHTQSSVNLSY